MKGSRAHVAVKRLGLRSVAALAVASVFVAASAGRPEPAASASGVSDGPTVVRIGVPRADNLQWMSFWVASGAGFFADEGIDVQLVVGQAPNALARGAADVAVLPRPAFLMQVGRRQPFVAFANLLANDPISLVLPRRVAEARGVSAEASLSDRLEAMRGLRVGVAPGPVTRLRYLLESEGLDADAHFDVVVVPGEEQNAALEEGRVDALYAHTPFLERALTEQDAFIVVNQSVGEVAGLADRQIHMLVTTRAYADGNADLLVAMARAVYRAQRLIHADRAAAADAIRRSDVELQAPDALDLVIELYEPAIPRTPEVSVGGVLRELELFPDHRELPDLSGVDMGAHVDNRFARRAVGAGLGQFSDGS